MNDQSCYNIFYHYTSEGTSKGNVGTSEGTSMGTTQNTSALEDEFMCKSPAISDIVILLDGSSSISRINFELARTFLENLVRAFSVGYDKTRIGLVQYSGDFWIEWHLNAHTTKEGVIEAIKNLLHKGGGTKTGQALIFILDTSFKAKFGSRPGVPKILILITDGDSQDDVTSPARSLREAGIELFAIGVRDAPFSELKAIASPPEETHVYNLADFSGLSNIVESLSKTVCERVEQLDTQIKDYIRLVNGSTHCSGRLEVRSNQSNQSNQWSSVCEEDFDQQDAEVVCSELGCGALSVLQGALYGEVEAPMWTKEFQCGGHESSLLYCRSSGSERNTCSPGKAVGLTCSEPVRLVGGASRCEGTLEVKYQGEWRPVDYYRWNLKVADVACRDLDCGSAVSIRDRESSESFVWRIPYDCVQSGSALRDCLLPRSSSSILDLTCSDSIRLVNGSSLCSGRLEVRSNQSNQSNQWSSVCEEDFDQQDAEVVCRELGCGALSVLQGALYGEVEAPMWPKEFQCGGHESSLLYCRSSGSERNTCSPGKAVGLTCSEPVRLVGGASRCEGTLEVEYQGEWRPVDYYRWNLKVADVACRDLDCGSAVSIRDREESSERSVWWIPSDCVQSGSAVRDCLLPRSSSSIMDLTCSKLLFQPIISVSSSMYGVSEAQQQGAQVLRGSTFTVCCSIQPQYPGGSFQLTSLSLNSAHNYTKPAVNHSANFLFPAAEPAHHGSYRCVYHLYVFSHDFSSESRLLRLSVEDPTPLIIKAVLLPLMLLWVNVALYLYCKTTRGRKLDRQEDFELDHRHLGVPAAEEEGAQGAG
uniref:scavenger receptor cysteine-rich type 1 protein M130-like n=1 Tax=Gasterosteus aculeatus aculeatus TaxID=481459 RepID=UPI001A98E7F6|nr:scavenger receptor cysteine-rich type 1 protein M130-like [Gasterosteus aculeatus aculeatus]